MWVTMMVISCHNSCKIFYIIYIFRKKFLQVFKYFCGPPYTYNPDQIYEITSSRLKINFILYLEIGRIERPNSRSVFNIWVIEITRNRDRFGLVLSYLFRCKSRITSDAEYYFPYNNHQSILYWRTLSSLLKRYTGCLLQCYSIFFNANVITNKKTLNVIEYSKFPSFPYFQFLVY